MKHYKDLERLKHRLIKNNGKKVNCWDDEGIKVAGKKYKLTAYGDIKPHKSYVIFNTKKEQIEIHYYLHKENISSRTNNIFEFVEMW